MGAASIANSYASRIIVIGDLANARGDGNPIPGSRACGEAAGLCGPRASRSSLAGREIVTTHSVTGDVTTLEDFTVVTKLSA
ncbi:MAG: hypothetical protein KIT09_04305 [Bryobacteraceae bacterium]|nr:hypothetical protein [Bryobacteraceae bacterium]